MPEELYFVIALTALVLSVAALNLGPLPDDYCNTDNSFSKLLPPL